MKETKVNLEWGYQIRVYGWGEFVTLRILRDQPQGYTFLTPHLQLDTDAFAEGGVDVSYGPWRLYDRVSIIRLDHCGKRVGMRVYVAFSQAVALIAQ